MLNIDMQLYPWLTPYWSQVQALRNQSRLPHALMLKSIAGLGAEQLAETIGVALLCQQPNHDGFACGECAHCKLVEAKTHPDFHFVSIPDTKKSIGVDQIRDIVNVCRERPHQGGYRIVIVNPAGAMTIGASNALLKTLEEPGDDTLLILVASATNPLPATVRSRCHLINIEVPPEAQGLDWLSGQHPESKNLLLLALRLSHHAPLGADQLLSSDTLQIRQSFLAGMARATDKNVEPLKLATLTKKIDVMTITDWLYSLILDYEKCLHHLPHEQLTNNDQSELLKRLCNHQGPKLQKWLDKVMEARRLLATSSNINPQLILEDLICRWIAIFN